MHSPQDFIYYLDQYPKYTLVGDYLVLDHKVLGEIHIKILKSNQTWLNIIVECNNIEEYCRILHIKAPIKLKLKSYRSNKLKSVDRALNTFKNDLLRAHKIKDGVIDTETIQQTIVNHYKPSKAIYKNVYLGKYERDVLLVKYDKRIYEFEIKTSKSDFLADKKKIGKHKKLKAGKDVNMFYYVCPDGIIPVEEVPKNYGLIYVTSENNISIIKNARQLHKNKISKEHLWNLLGKDSEEMFS